MSATAPERRPGGRLRRPDQHPYVLLATRLVIAQTVAAAAVGLPFSHRHLPSVLITLSMVVAFCLLALLARTGTRAAWTATLGLETGVFLYGLSRFVTARYVGGTLFALVTAITLLHPAVARAYSVLPARLDSRRNGEVGLPGPAGETCGGRTAG